MSAKQFYVKLKKKLVFFQKETGLKSLAGERISKFFVEKKIFYSDDLSICNSSIFHEYFN
jgi:hypothetical protein